MAAMGGAAWRRAAVLQGGMVAGAVGAGRLRCYALFYCAADNSKAATLGNCVAAAVAGWRWRLAWRYMPARAVPYRLRRYLVGWYGAVGLYLQHVQLYAPVG